jgi:uncharacterized protein (TIGR00255 family)
MIKSMTGFGSAEAQCDQWMLRAEVRSVNHRDLQASFRLPEMFQLKEYELQKLLEKGIHRGHVYLALTCRPRSGGAMVMVDQGVVRQYLDSLKSVAASAQMPVSVDLAALLALPGTLRDMASDEELKQALWPHVVRTVEAAVGALVEMRRAEGANLAVQLRGLCASIGRLAAGIKEAQGESVAVYHDRLRERVTKLLAGADVPLSEESLAREVAIYADHCDVSEEVARLMSHLQQFEEALEAGGEPVGRKMEFLGQEMMREASTIAAKAPAGTQGRPLLELRSEIDRLREQVRNVE